MIPLVVERLATHQHKCGRWELGGCFLAELTLLSAWLAGSKQRNAGGGWEMSMMVRIDRRMAGALQWWRKGISRAKYGSFGLSTG